MTSIPADAGLRFCAATAALKLVKQNQHNDAHAHREDCQHDDKLFAIHT
jgi:hypothetical protein